MSNIQGTVSDDFWSLSPPKSPPSTLWRIGSLQTDATVIAHIPWVTLDVSYDWDYTASSPTSLSLSHRRR